MKREEYIEKYGKDAYEKYLAYLKEYREVHKDKLSIQKKEWYKLNNEKVRERNKNRYNEKKEEIKEYWTNYRNKKKDEIKERKAKYYINNKDLVNKKHREWIKNTNYYKSINYRASRMVKDYRYSDVEHDRGDCTLTKEYMISDIFNSMCIYCGDSNWKHLGCDRIDNNLPHTPENCVCSCGICNIERANRKMSVEEFVEYRKTHPRDEEPKKLQEIVEINGKKVIRKVL